MEKRNPISASKLREILNRAVVDQSFRKDLFENPKVTLASMKLSKEEYKSLIVNFDEKMMKHLEAIDEHISLLSESVLCSGGGGCGGIA